MSKENQIKTANPKQQFRNSNDRIMSKEEQIERIEVMEFYEGMTLERFYKVMLYFVESNSEALTGETATTPNGDAIAPLFGRTLSNAMMAAMQIRDKNPHLPPVPKNGYDLLNWAKNGIEAAKDAETGTPTKTDDTTDEIPADLIKLKVAVADYKVSRNTLLTEIGHCNIKSYRDKNAKRNAAHLVSRAAMVKYGRRKVEIVHKYPKNNGK